MAGPFSSFKLQVREGSPTKSNVDPQAEAHGVVVGEEIGCLFEFTIARHGFVLWTDEVIHHEAVASRLLEAEHKVRSVGRALEQQVVVFVHCGCAPETAAHPNVESFARVATCVVAHFWNGNESRFGGTVCRLVAF